MISYEINRSAPFLQGKESNSVLLDQHLLSCLQEDIARKPVKVEGRVVLDFAVAQMEKLETHARKWVRIYVVIGRRLLMSFEFLKTALLCKNALQSR